jgi:NAD+ synthase
MELHNKQSFNKEILYIKNVDDKINQIATKLNNDITISLKRKGAVVGLSGGIDSSVTLALTVKAIGSDKVLGVLMPEKDSSKESKILATQLADKFNIKTVESDITQALEGFGCYYERDVAVSNIFPEYDPMQYTMKIGINPAGINHNIPPLFSLTIVDKEGASKSKILPLKEYLQIVAASNFKQRSRMSMLYYHGERLHYAVIGTPNKHEVEQGFFVKNGDGGADIMPIGNLYKTQVYQLADRLGIPEDIINRTPTSDTYSAEQTQEEFFFQLPFRDMDMLWYGYENGYNAVEVAETVGKTTEEINAIFRNFQRKQRTTEYLRMPPIKDYV